MMQALDHSFLPFVDSGAIFVRRHTLVNPDHRRKHWSRQRRLVESTPKVTMLPQLGGNGMYNKWFLGCCAAALIAWSGAVEAGTLDRLRQDSTIRVAYRRDAPPFSYQN